MTNFNKIKLLYFIDSLRLGGAERLTVPILGNMNRELFDIRVCSLQRKHDKMIGVPVDQLDIQRLRSPSNLPKMLAYLNAVRPNLVHTQLQFSDSLGTLCASLLKIPSVSTQHLSDLMSDKKNLRRQKFTWWVLRNFSIKIITVSEKTRQFHQNVGRIPHGKFVTIYNGIEVNRFSEIPKNVGDYIRDKFFIPKESIVITTVAVLRKPKGIQFMIQAVGELIKILPGIRYLVIGDGAYKDQLEKLSTQMGLDNHVIFTGQRSDIPEILASSDIFVLPTLADALPTVLFEAQAAGLPIIASNVGGIPEIITNGHDGMLIPHSDPGSLVSAIETLIQDKSIREKYSVNGLETVRTKFSIENQVEQLTELYLDILSE